MKKLIPVIAVLACAPAFGQGYAGVSIGQLNLDDTIEGLRFDGDDFAWRVFGGWQFNQHFATEVGYIDGGTASDRVEGIDVEAETDGFQASALGIMPISQVFSLHAKLGLVAWNADLRALGFEAETDGVDPIYGVGFGLNFNRLVIRTDYEMADFDGTDGRSLMVNFLWRF